MSKLLLIAIIAIAGIGIATGVIEVKINSEKLSAIPAIVQDFITSKDLLAQGEYYITSWKRKAEVAMANSDDKKFDLYVAYVQTDTEKLKDAFDKNAAPGSIIVRTKLLNESVALAKEGVENISEEAIASTRDAWVKTLADANTQLQRLSALAGEYKQYQEQLEDLAPSPAEAPSPSPEATPEIPLKF